MNKADPYRDAEAALKARIAALEKEIDLAAEVDDEAARKLEQARSKLEEARLELVAVRRAGNPKVTRGLLISGAVGAAISVCSMVALLLLWGVEMTAVPWLLWAASAALGTGMIGLYRQRGGWYNVAAAVALLATAFAFCCVGLSGFMDSPPSGHPPHSGMEFPIDMILCLLLSIVGIILLLTADYLMGVALFTSRKKRALNRWTGLALMAAGTLLPLALIFSYFLELQFLMPVAEMLAVSRGAAHGALMALFVLSCLRGTKTEATG